jgi:heme A synthase
LESLSPPTRRGSDDQTAQSDPRWHWTLLIAALVVVIVAALLVANSDGSLSPRSVPSLRFPVICPLRRFFGIPCPTCGMTRSVVHLVQGRPLDSFAAHRLGPLMLAIILFQIPYRIWRLTGRPGLPISPRLGKFAIVSFLLLLAVNWLAF